jgi:hypothetical protein
MKWWMNCFEFDWLDDDADDVDDNLMVCWLTKMKKKKIDC